MRYTTIVFDFDGTLADTYAEGIAIFARIGPSLGMTILSSEELEEARALPTRQFLRRVGISLWRLPRVIRRYQDEAAEIAHTMKLFEGIPELLTELRRLGYRLGIVSSNRESTIRTCLNANGCEHLFDFVIGHPRLFGKGRVLRRALKDRNIPRDQALYVGDESRDVVAARKARVEIAAVTWGFQPEATLRDSGALQFARTPQDLLRLLHSSAEPSPSSLN